MRLLPREQERLLLFLAAELARRRRARGLRLSQAEAVALIADEVCEAARDGLGYAEVEAHGYRVLERSDVLEGVEDLVARIEVEALFADGSRLLVLERPIALDSPPRPAEIAPAWLSGAGDEISVVNEGLVPIAVTSHLHFFEANPRLRFDRAGAWGMRLALSAGSKVHFAPEATVGVRLIPIAGARIVRGQSGLHDGPLDQPGAREAALALARERGYLGA